MKNRLSFVITIMITILLVGCNFSFGDGEKIEISTEGVPNSESADGQAAADEIEEVTDENGVEEEQGEVEDAEESVAAEGESDLSKILTGEQACEDDYYDLLEIMPENFSMPDCAEVQSANVHNRDYMNRYEYTGSYTVEKSWKEVFTLYLDYLKANDFAVQTQNKGKMDGELSSKKDVSTLEISIQESAEGITTVRINYYVIYENEDDEGS